MCRDEPHFNSLLLCLHALLEISHLNIPPNSLAHNLTLMAAFLSPTPLHACFDVRTRLRICYRPVVIATIAPQRVTQSKSPTPPQPTPPTTDGPYDRFMIWGLRALLRMQTGNTSPLPGYSGLVDECRLLLATKGAEEQRNLVERLLSAAVMPPIGVFLFRKFFKDNPKFNADLTPLVFTWLVGKAERKNIPEGGEGVFIEKCRFLEEARCKGLYVVALYFCVFIRSNHCAFPFQVCEYVSTTGSESFHQYSWFTTPNDSRL